MGSVWPNYVGPAVQPAGDCRVVAASRIVWSPEFSVGNDLLDKQHQILIVQINRLADWIDGPASSSTYHDILNELAMYSQVHFKSEELMLQRIRYAELNSQIDEHDSYVAYLTDVMLNSLRNVIDKVHLQAFLVDWWSNHIQVSDMKYKGLV